MPGKAKSTKKIQQKRHEPLADEIEAADFAKPIRPSQKAAAKKKEKDTKKAQVDSEEDSFDEAEKVNFP
jgi:hypothetical protein